MSNSIRVERSADRTIIRFDRPESRNPLSVEVIRDIHAALDDLGDARCLIFTGRDGVFAAGADLRQILALPPDEATSFGRMGQELMQRIAGLSATTISAVNGPCFGGALDLAVSCDRRIASPSASFCHPGAGLGMMTGWGGTQLLPRLIGEGRAMEMFLTATPISADRALHYGLVDEISPDPEAAAINFRSP